MKKLRRVIGTVTNRGASGSRDGSGSPTSAGGLSGPLAKSRRSLSIASSLHTASPADGSYISYDTHSMGSHNSFASSVGADIDPYSKNDKTFTKLHKWAYLGDVSKLRKFVKKVPINSRDSEGRSALHVASSQGHADALLFLLGSKGDVEMQDNAGMTPLLRATEKGHIQLVQMLLQRRVDIHILDYDGNGAAHLAARTGSTDLLELLLDCGVDCDTQNKLGRSPVHFGCQESHEGMVESLLRRGAEVNVVDKEGVSPLMMAAKLGNRQLVDILLDQGANVSPKDSSNWTAADYARFTNHNQLQRHLKSLMEGNGRKASMELFPQGLFSSQEKDDSDDEIAPLGAMAASTTSADEDEGNSWKDKNNSWSDGSEAASIKEKPKFNISKFIQSSDESPDVPLHHISSQEALGHASSHGSLSQNTGPPKPPRLYTSSSSLDQPLDDKRPQTGAEAEKDRKKSKVNKSDDDSWGDSTDTEPKFKPSVKLNTDSDIENSEVLLAANSPEKLNFEIGIPSNARRLSQDNLDLNIQPVDHVRKDNLLANMELGSMEFHSSEEVSFGEDEEVGMLPEEQKSTDTGNKSTIHSVEKQLKHSPLQTPVNSPLKSSTHSSLTSPVNIEKEEMQSKPPSISSKSSTPTKKQRTPSKERQRNIQKSYDSDSEGDQAQLSSRPPRRKSLIPSGKKFGNFPFLSSHSASEADADEEEEKITRKIKSKRELFPSSDGNVNQNSNEELEKNIDKESDSWTGSDNEEKRNENLNKKRAIFGSSHEKETKSNEKLDKDSNKESGSWMDSDIDFSSSSLPKDGSRNKNEIIHDSSPVNLSPNKNHLDNKENSKITTNTNNIQNVTDNSNNKDGDRNSPDNDDYPAQKSRGSTLSTVVGTLGREGTMQETEELWEANASISPRRRDSIISSEESSKSDTTNLGQDHMKPSEEKSKEVVTSNKSNDLASNKQLNLTESHSKRSIKSLQDKISPTIEEESGSFSIEKSSTSPKRIAPPKKDSVPFRPLLRRRSSVTSDQLIQIMTNTSLNKQNRPRPSRQSSVSGLGSIVFSDEESLSLDHRSHLTADEVDDGVSAASTETEESAHINSGLKDSLLTPLSSLPNNMDIGQLQDLIRELRLKLEKESGRRHALESKVVQLKKSERQERQQCHRLEEDMQHKQQEIVSLSSRVSALDYQSRCEEDSGRLKTQSLEDTQHRCQQLEEELVSLRASMVHDEQVLESLRAQISTKDCINQSLQERINHLTHQSKIFSVKSIQTEEVPSICTTSSEVQTISVIFTNADVQTDEQPSKLHLIEGQTQTYETIINSESVISTGYKDLKTNYSQTEFLVHKNFGVQTENEELPKLHTDDPKSEKLPEEHDVGVQTDLELLDELIQQFNVSSKQLTAPVASTTQTESANVKCNSAQTDFDIEFKSEISSSHLEHIPQALESCNTEHIATQTHILNQNQLIQTDELHLSTLQVQTDMMMSNCEVVPKKQIVNSECQTMTLSKQIGCQTDVEFSVPAKDDQALGQNCQELSSAPTLDVSHQLHRVLSPMIAILTQDMKTVIDESFESNGNKEPQMRESLTAALTDHLRVLEERLISKMQQSVLIQNEDLGNQQSEGLKRLQQQLVSQLDTLSHQQQQEANKQFQLKSSESQDYQQQLSRLQSSFQRGMEDLRSNLTALYGRQENTSRLAQLDATLLTLTETNKQVQASLVRSVEESRVGSYEALQQMQSHLTMQLQEAQNVIKLAIMSKFSSNDDQQEISQSILVKLDNMEKSIVNSLTPVWDTSPIESEVRQLSHEMHKKISVLQKSMESSELEQKQQELVQNLSDLKESHKGLAALIKSRSASSVDVSEAVEENFHIMQDHIRKLQTALMSKVNELSQQTSIAEEQKSTWLSKQLSEITTQIVATQCNLSRLQTFVESSASLPTSGHLDETILTTMKVSSDQSLASLKFQNQSVISLLESLQKEVHSALGQIKSSDVDTRKEVQILQEQLISREQEVTRLNSLKEDHQDKIHQLNYKIERLTQQEDEYRQRAENLQKKVHSLEACLRQREDKLDEEAKKVATHMEELTHLRQETFRLNTENNKLVTLHQTEQQRSQWFEGQVQGLRESRVTSEAKVQELVTQLQLSHPPQRMPPTGRDLSDDDDVENYRREIKKLQADKQALENKSSDLQNKGMQLEVQVEDISSRLGLERNHKEDLEREMRKTKETLHTLRRGLNETTHEHSQLQDAIDRCKELEAEEKFKEAAIATLKNKLEEINEQKLEMKQEIMQFKEERLSFDLLKHEKELVEKMHKSTEEQLQEIRKRLSRDFIPKSNLEYIQKDFESKYQHELSTRLSELNQLIEEQNKQQESRRKIKESRDQDLKNEMSRMSEEVIRLRARLSVHDEEDDTWKTRYERLMDLYHREQHGSGTSKYQRLANKSSDNQLGFNLQEIEAHLKTPLATSTLLGQLTPPSSLQIPVKGPSNSNDIGSYHYTHQDALERTLNKYLKDDKFSVPKYRINESSHPEDNISSYLSKFESLQHNTSMYDSLRQNGPVSLDKSCEDYMNVLKMKYGF